MDGYQGLSLTKQGLAPSNQDWYDNSHTLKAQGLAPFQQDWYDNSHTLTAQGLAPSQQKAYQQELCTKKLKEDYDHLQTTNLNELCDYNFHSFDVNGGGPMYFLLAFENPRRTPRGKFGGTCVEEAVKRLENMFATISFRVIVADLSPVKTDDGVSLLKCDPETFKRESTAHTSKMIDLMLSENCLGVIFGAGQLPPSKPGFSLRDPKQNHVRTTFLELLEMQLNTAFTILDDPFRLFYVFHWGLSKCNGCTFGSLFKHFSALRNINAPLLPVSLELLKIVHQASKKAPQIEKNRLN